VVFIPAIIGAAALLADGVITLPLPSYPQLKDSDDQPKCTCHPHRPAYYRSFVVIQFQTSSIGKTFGP
jgi:hypothetical protein